MGQPKFPRKKYATPQHPWKEERIKSERELIKKYGLKNHREVWKAKTHLGRYREHARELLARVGSSDPQIKKESDQLLLHLTRMGILPMGSSLDDVLALETESVLSRRLQTLVYLKGLSSTVDQSRQLINHGHIQIKDHKITIPGYLVKKEEEQTIGYTQKSPLNELSHPSRPKSDVYKTIIPSAKKEEAPSDAKQEPPTEKQEGKAGESSETKKPEEPVKPREATPQQESAEPEKQEPQPTEPSEKQPEDQAEQNQEDTLEKVPEKEEEKPTSQESPQKPSVETSEETKSKELKKPEEAPSEEETTETEKKETEGEK